MLVVFPAPFGPRNAHTSPEFTAKETCVSAGTSCPLNRGRYTFVTASNSIAVVTRSSCLSAFAKCPPSSFPAVAPALPPAIAPLPLRCSSPLPLYLQQIELESRSPNMRLPPHARDPAGR